MLASANLPRAVEKLYAARHRSHAKGCILLVSRLEDIPNLSGNHAKTYLKLCAERPTTIIVPAPEHYLPHLIRQGNTLAFRLVPEGELATIIHETGPLLAPSANVEGQPPAQTITEARDYFGDRVALYVDGGAVEHGAPSKIIAINDSDEIEIVRA